MPLKLCRTGLGFGIDKGRPDYTVFTGKLDVGRIYQIRGGPRARAGLVADRQPPDGALGSCRDTGRGQGPVSEELERLEGLGESGGGALR